MRTGAASAGGAADSAGGAALGELADLGETITFVTACNTLEERLREHIVISGGELSAESTN